MNPSGWLKPNKEKNRLIVEVSNDKDDTYIIDVPHSRKSEGILTDLVESGVTRDPLPEQSMPTEVKAKNFQARDSDKYRWQADESIDKEEDLEDNGDFEPDDFREHDYCDDEESEQSAVRFWPLW